MQFVTQALGQLSVCLVLVTLFWSVHLLLARWRKARPQSWSRWLGLHCAPRLSNRWWLFPCAFLFGWAAILTQSLVLEGFATFYSETPAYRISRSSGLDLALGAIAYPFVTSALTEEIFFRGFVAQRLIKNLGFAIGNALQTLIFLAPHVLLVQLFAEQSETTLLLLLALTVTPFAWISGWIMTKHDEGSILSPWLMHSGLNFGTLVYFWLWIPTVHSG